MDAGSTMMSCNGPMVLGKTRDDSVSDAWHEMTGHQRVHMSTSSSLGVRPLLYTTSTYVLLACRLRS